MIQISDDQYGRDMMATADFIKGREGEIWAGPNLDIYFLTGRMPVAEKGYIPFLNAQRMDTVEWDKRTFMNANAWAKYIVIDKFKHQEEGWLPLTNEFAREQKRVFENEHFLVGEL